MHVIYTLDPENFDREKYIYICVRHFEIYACSGVTRALIGGGGCVYSYIRVLPGGFLLK